MSNPTDTPTTDYPLEVEVGQLMNHVRELKTEIKRHRGNVVEAHAFAIGCPRHLPHMRGCAWDADRACTCRAAVASHFPEYANG